MNIRRQKKKIQPKKGKGSCKNLPCKTRKRKVKKNTKITELATKVLDNLPLVIGLTIGGLVIYKLAKERFISRPEQDIENLPYSPPANGWSRPEQE